MKAADIIKKKGHTPDKSKTPPKAKAGSLLDWIGNRRNIVKKTASKEDTDNDEK